MTAALFVELADGFGESLCVESQSIALSTAVADAHLIIRNGGQGGLWHLYRQVLVILGIIVVGLYGCNSEKCQ